MGETVTQHSNGLNSCLPKGYFLILNADACESVNRVFVDGIKDLEMD